MEFEELSLLFVGLGVERDGLGVSMPGRVVRGRGGGGGLCGGVRARMGSWWLGVGVERGLDTKEEGSLLLGVK